MSGSRLRSKPSVVVVIVAILLIVDHPFVLGSNWYGASGGTGCSGNMQDNSTMTFHRDINVQSDANLHNAIAKVHNEEVTPSDLTVQSEQVSPDSNTDVVYHNSDYVGNYCGYTWHSPGSSGSSSLIGFVACAALSGSKCQRFDVYLDRSWTSGRTRSELERFACHEIGHALGLIHPSSSNGGTTSCVSSGHPVFGYSAHDVSHLNANY